MKPTTTFQAAFVLACIVFPLVSFQSHAQPTLVELQKTFAGRSVPTFNNGYFAAYDHDELPGTPLAYIFATDGSVRLKVPFKLDGAFTFRIAAVAPTPAGGMVVSVGAFMTDGSRSTRLVWIDPSGQVVRTVDTQPYYPVLVHVRPDGEVWTAGRVIENERFSESHDILRRYSAEGRVLQNLLNWDSYPSPSKIGGHPDDIAYLFGDAGRVAFLSVTAMDLAIVDLATGKIERWRLPGIAGRTLVTGAGFTPAGAVVVSAQGSGKTGALCDLYEWRADKASWSLLPAPTLAGDVIWRGHLVGADGHGMWLSGPRHDVFRHTP